MGGMPSMPTPPDPYSAEAVGSRQDEYLWQQTMAREDMAFQRDEANTQREWEEDLERRKALSSTKEEEARIRALREEQEAAVESGQETAMAMGDMQDTDTANSNMWSSLASGSDGAWGSLYGDD